MSSQGADLSQGPLAGIRVLDMGSMLAGPYGATLMGDLGADVIKVESHRGDDSRHLGPERDGERSPYLSLNRSKRAIVLELDREGGRRGLQSPGRDDGRPDHEHPGAGALEAGAQLRAGAGAPP